jgi:hypothetical protein
LLNLIEAQQEMKQKTGNQVGDIRPHNIFLNAEGSLKISCINSWPNESINFTKTAFDNEATYLSPEDMQKIDQGNL